MCVFICGGRINGRMCRWIDVLNSMYRRCHLHWRACNLYFIYATMQSCKTYQEPSSSAGGPCVRKGSCAGSNENCGAYCKPKRAMQNEVSYAIKLVFQMCRLQLKANKQKQLMTEKWNKSALSFPVTPLWLGIQLNFYLIIIKFV